ncbi:MAG: YjgN family protein, partial [Betaproteobacteria bacterium]|nr:YjgN family protein [Betaproteobacteria bacterium]
MAHAESAAARGERIVRPEFTGSAREYFRIWIVNLFFTLITLGIYSAWAKVRKKRYFYGCTRIDGDTFDYFASPKVILKGRIVAFVLFVAYAFSTQLYPVSAYGFWAVFLVVLPWLVVRALAFNARNSAYRGLRFEFAATPGETARVYIGMPLIVVLTAGLAYPWFMARQKSFVVSRHAFGKSRLACDVRVRSFYAAYLLAALAMVVLFAPVVFLMVYAMTKLELPEEFAWAAIFVPVALMYAVYALVYAFV